MRARPCLAKKTCSAGTRPESPLDTRRLGEFFAEPKNLHGASNITGPKRNHCRPHRWCSAATEIVGLSRRQLLPPDVHPESGGRCVRRADG